MSDKSLIMKGAIVEFFQGDFLYKMTLELNIMLSKDAISEMANSCNKKDTKG